MILCWAFGLHLGKFTKVSGHMKVQDLGFRELHILYVHGVKVEGFGFPPPQLCGTPIRPACLLVGGLHRAAQVQVS